MIRTSVGVVCLAVLAVTLGVGCPMEFPKPPFDVSGTYDGVWNGNSTDQKQQVIGCPLSVTLAQNINASYPADHGVSGTVVIDYSCVQLPEWADEPLPTTLSVGGILEDNGKLTLLTGGCDTAICVVLSLAGQGADVDEDGLMDTYEGSWAFTILLAGVEPFGVTGTFDVAAAAP